MEEKQKGFFGKLFDKLDEKLKDKSGQCSCCCDSEKEEKTKCCEK